MRLSASLSLILFLAAALGAGQAEGKVYVVQPKPFRAAEGAPQGCISATLGRIHHPGEGRLYRKFILGFQAANAVGEKAPRLKVEGFGYTPKDKTTDFADDVAWGQVFTVCVPPGDYNLSYIDVMTGAITEYHDEPRRIPFRVEAGHNYYLGSFRLTALHHDPSLAKRDYASCTGLDEKHFVQLRDESAQDLPRIMQAKNAPATTPEVAVLQPLDERSDLVACHVPLPGTVAEAPAPSQAD